MKIVIVLPAILRVPSGGYKIIYEYSNYLVKRGYSVVFFYDARKSMKRFHFPEVFRRIMCRFLVWYHPNWFEVDKKIVKKCFFDQNEIDKIKYDLILATGVTTAEIVKNVHGAKKLYLIQDFENWSVSDEYVYRTYGYGFLNITVSNWLKKIVDTFAQDKALCISNSIDTNIFKFVNPIECRNNHTMAFHYRSAPYKGCQYAIKVIKCLQKIYLDLNVYVVSSEKKPNNLPDCCKFIHNAKPEQVAKINNNVAVFMCTSVKEGFGLPGLEAMACGAVLVSTKYQGVFEYAVDEYNALLSDVGDVDAMVKNIVRLFENDELRTKLAKNGIKVGQSRSLDIACKQFENILLGKI